MLSAQHYKMLHDESVIADSIIDERGYRTIEKKSELKALGFSDSQCRIPALDIPIFSVTGEVVLHQIRPDLPRLSRDGKPIKYDIPRGARITLDVPPSIRHHIGSKSRPLFIAEGVKKADSAASHDLCCIDLLGVWNFRGKNDEGGKTVLAAWEHIALESREVFIVFDSDVALKPAVYKALVRLKAFLESRGALVRAIYLDPKLDGSKIGLDDFFAAGHTLAELLAKATDKLRPGPEPEREFPYKETPNGLVWLKPTRDGMVETPLCNFTARILSDLVEDDGVETKRAFEVEAQQNGKKAAVKVSAERFAGMAWTAEALGSRAILAPGPSVKDHTRVAIQLFSQNVVERHVYTHLGWRKIDGCWCYLHAGGAIGAEGSEQSVEVAVPAALERYILQDPPQGEELKTAIRASLRLLDVAPSQLTFPCLSAIYRAVLGDSDFSLHLSGLTGIGKSEIAALVQQHFGPELTARHLPASWASTGNSLEGLAFTAKDAVLVVDDFAPTGSAPDVQRFHREADRILRAQGNRAGRLRMRSDAMLKAAKPPRGLIVSTGEDIPRGQSLRSRMFTLEVSPGDVDWSVITQCQHDAASGLYAQALAGFLRWLARQYDDIKDRLKAEINDLRQQAIHINHRRTPDIVANLAMGFWYFLNFAVESSVVSEAEKDSLWGKAWAAFAKAAQAQAQYQEASEPARRFLELLTAALAGGRAHIASHTGAFPNDAEAWGWRLEDAERVWIAKGMRVGWLSDDNVYLDPDVALAEAQRLARDQGDSFPLTVQTLSKRLKEQAYLASWDNASQTVKVRRILEGKKRHVLHLRKDIFTEGLSPHKKPSKPSTDPSDPKNEADQEANAGFSETQHQAKPSKPSTDPAPENQAKSNGYEPNAGNAGHSVGGEGFRTQTNFSASFSGENGAGNAGFSGTENPAPGTENPAPGDEVFDWDTGEPKER